MAEASLFLALACSHVLLMLPRMFLPVVFVDLLLLPVVQTPFPGGLGVRRHRGNSTDSGRFQYRTSLL